MSTEALKLARDALDTLIDECEAANRTALSYLGVGLIDLNTIEAGRAALAAAPAGGAEPVAIPEGWKLVLVNEGFDDLMAGLERSFRNGHLTDGYTADYYEAFDYRDAAPTAQPEPVVLFDDRPQNQRIAEAEERMRNPAPLQWEDGDPKFQAMLRMDDDAQPERLPYCSAIDPTLLAIHARTVERAERLGLDDAQPEAPAEPSDKPLGYVKFRAAQTLQTDGYCDGHEWLEFCEPGELGDDKKPAFPVYATPQAAPAAPLPALSYLKLYDIIGEHLTSAYCCTRVWDAWSVGTMSQDDFTPLADTDFQNELADAIIKAQGDKHAEE